MNRHSSVSLLHFSSDLSKSKNGRSHRFWTDIQLRHTAADSSTCRFIRPQSIQAALTRYTWAFARRVYEILAPLRCLKRPSPLDYDRTASTAWRSRQTGSQCGICDFTKTAFYPIQSVRSASLTFHGIRRLTNLNEQITWQKKAQYNIFSTRSETEHREQKRKVANVFTSDSLLKMEDSIDDCGNLFVSRMHDFARDGKAVDLGAWLQFYGACAWRAQK